MPDVADDQQLSLPSLVVILVVSGLIIRYFFFSSSSSSAQPPRSGRAAAQAGSDPAALMRAREAAAERIQQMFPQVDRRTALWDLQRTGGNVALTTERILAGRLETPPITFQPPPPPGSGNAGANVTTPQSKPATPSPSYPDLITRYNLKDKLNAPLDEAEGSSSSKPSGKGWSSSREERQSLLQRRRDQMILEARRKMEAKIAAEKAAEKAAEQS
ncbi:hypothetical protein VTH06DRAFT_3047 [Thermothelomyces fergusii]